MTPIYVFSGLGADERVFQLLDFTGLSVTFVQWIVPEQGEKISEYAHRPNSSKLKHIHGTADRILPYQFVSSDLTIEQGGHLMIPNKADELTKATRSLI